MTVAYTNSYRNIGFYNPHEPQTQHPMYIAKRAK